MKRKTFIKQSGVIVFGLAAFGNIHWNGDAYVSDSPTTTDILGPFYRPGAPLRTNLNPPGYSGDVLKLSGTVYRDHGKTPARGCKIEIWQCKPDGYYDNLSNDYSYRGYTTTGKNGKYEFITVQPPPEPTDETKSVYRPAHIHLRITASGQQDLITQIYFSGDQLLSSDPSTKSSLTINRILTVERLEEKVNLIHFDIFLGKDKSPDSMLVQRVCGTYKMSDGSLMEFYEDGELLFYKINGQIWGALSYRSDNTFTGMNTEATFAPANDGTATVHFEFLRRRETKLDGKKILDYQ